MFTSFSWLAQNETLDSKEAENAEAQRWAIFGLLIVSRMTADGLILAMRNSTPKCLCTASVHVISILAFI